MSISYADGRPVDAAEQRRDFTRDRAVKNFVAKQFEKSSRSQCAYDSAVIAGNGIGALTFAGRLAQDPRFAGKVTVVAPPILENRRLIQGVNLRGLGADFIAAGLGTNHATLIDTFSGPNLIPVYYRQTVGNARFDGTHWKLGKPSYWMGGRAGTQEPNAYGFRNSRVTAGMNELASKLPIQFVQEKVENADHLRSYATGDKPLLVNATPNATLLGDRSMKPKRQIIAVQVPFVEKPAGTHLLERETAYFPCVFRDGVMDVGYFTPFSDPLSPRSRWYGIVARIFEADSGFDKDAEMAIMTEELFGLGDALGLVPDDPEETMARALVPGYPWGKVPPSMPGTLNLSRAYAGGSPTVYADGMTSAAIGGYVGAEAVLSGANPDRMVRKALWPIRFHNYLWYLETNRVTPVSQLLLKINPKIALLYPHTAGRRNWISGA